MSTDVDDVMEVLSSHTIGVAVMAGWTHWAYRGTYDPATPGVDRVPREGETPGKWFAWCADDFWNPDRRGCGWDSKPITYETKEEAYAVAKAHLAQKIAEAL